jgi:apolipoprotein N-acyltransferase
LLGYSQYHYLALIQSADVLGVYGISFLLVAANTALALLLCALAERSWFGRPVPLHRVGISLGAVALVAVGFIFYGKARIATVDQQIARAPHADFGIVQGNIPQDIKWNKAFAKETLDRYLSLSKEVSPAPDVIVWPETAVPFYFPYDAEFSLKLVKGIKNIGTDFIIGSPSVTVLEPEKTLQYHNSVFMVSGAGEIVNRYDKSHLVPFGEYVPLRRWLPFLGTIVAQVGDFAAGQPGAVLNWRDHKVGPLICFEMIFANMTRAQVRNGANLLVNVTNDAWYGRSSAPYQHFSMAVLRAVENRRALVRSANTGISGFIDPVGRIGKSSELFVETTLSQPVALLSGLTPYVRWGDFFAWSCLAAAVLAGISAGVIRKTSA